MEKTSTYAIIVAGGKGLRMGGDIPKQFLPIGNIPVLMRTIRRFRQYDDGIKIILVLPHSQQEYWKELCREYSFSEPVVVADGGETRFHSVRNGLNLIPNDENGVVMVHDGVRPFLSIDTIRKTCEGASKYGAAVPVVPVVDTLRHLDDAEHSVTVPRDEYRTVQTPQTFDIQLLKKAYKQDYDNKFTDDASVVESCGIDVALVEGNRENIKITTPFDISLAEAILKNA